MRRILFPFLLFLVLIANGAGLADALRVIHNADIIFIQTNSPLAPAIQAVTGSKWDHVGMLLKISKSNASKVVAETDDGIWKVYESVGPVQIITLDSFLKRSHGDFVVRRLKNVAVDQNKAQALFNSCATQNGKHYDFYFVDPDRYCSGFARKHILKTFQIPVGEEIPMTSPKLHFESKAAKDYKQKFFVEQKAPFNEDVWKTKTTTTPASIFNDDEHLVDVGTYAHPSSY